MKTLAGMLLIFFGVITFLVGLFWVLNHFPNHNYKVCALADGSLTPTNNCATGAIQWDGQCVTVWPENTNVELFYCKDVWLEQVSSTSQ